MSLFLPRVRWLGKKITLYNPLDGYEVQFIHSITLKIYFLFCFVK